MREYIKHAIECNCILPQYVHHKPTVFHKFVVFSVIEEDGSVCPSYAECNNCGAVHRVKEVGRSVQIAREMSRALPKIEELKLTIPASVVAVLESYRCDLPTWQEVRFIYDEGAWGRSVILSKETDDDVVVGKFLLIISREIYKIDTFSQGKTNDD